MSDVSGLTRDAAAAVVAPPAPLLFAGIEGELAALDRLPRGLWLGSLIHSRGKLAPRLDAVERLRQGLIAGRVDNDPLWPDSALAEGMARTLSELELPKFCRDDADLSELVLRSLLWHLDRIVDFIDRGDSPDDAARRVLAEFAEDWQERCDTMQEFGEVFGDIDDLLKNSRWDQLHGLLRREGWQDVVRIRRLIERLPELARIVRGLGRLRPCEAIDENSLRRDLEMLEERSAPRTRSRIVRVPELPGETRGICRSARIARMLPAETMLLAHPRLRLIWHARHAERSLLTYEDDDRMEEVLHEHAPVWQPGRQRRPDRRLESGPLLICVDTSASMQGGAEAVAKATVLEAVRVAWAQKRACHVFAFGGPSEIVDLEIGADPQGLERLIEFIGQTFRGGTDICGPLEAVIARLADERWRLADLLIASDGEFGATPDTARRLNAAKAELGLRVQGILIGDRETIGLAEIADDIFWIRDWRHYGTSDAASPVHSARLTAIYFPGAMRSPENLGATVTGASAAETIRRGSTPARQNSDPGAPRGTGAPHRPKPKP